MVSTPMFFPSIGVVLIQAFHCGKFFVILHLNGSPKSIQYGYFCIYETIVTVNAFIVKDVEIFEELFDIEM